MIDHATAFREWDERWKTTSGRTGWTVPEPDVLATARRLRAAGAAAALDMGCGIGRHTVVLAEAGFAVAAVDASESGLRFAAATLAESELTADFRVAPMTDLPFADGAFDYVLAWNVIYHGDPAVVRRAIAEIRRVLRPGGTYQGTMLSKRNVTFARGREVAPDTWVLDGVSDKSHPHYYCNARELVALFDGFELRSLYDAEHETPGTFHWHVVAERINL